MKLRWHPDAEFTRLMERYQLHTDPTWQLVWYQKIVDHINATLPKVET